MATTRQQAPEYHHGQQTQQYPPQREPMRPRSKSAFSVTSNHSKTSRRSVDKEALKETADEKHKLQFSNTTKANPNAAMTELQPSMFMGEIHCINYGMLIKS
jgi:hypothetical protein